MQFEPASAFFELKRVLTTAVEGLLVRIEEKMQVDRRGSYEPGKPSRFVLYDRLAQSDAPFHECEEWFGRMPHARSVGRSLTLPAIAF